MSRFKTAVVAVATVAAIGLGSSPALAAGQGGDTGTAQPGPAKPKSCSAYGGTFFCGGDYGDGKTSVTLSDGTKQIFVVGTDYDIWTTWFPPKGAQAPWMSLGGDHDFVNKVKISNKKGNAFTVGARSFHLGADLNRDRDNGGAWSGWWTKAVPAG
ncbi:hypothetical protein [Kitasatospora sp. NPDC059327]|uniref:hypothetical protein n=1 Tax=Kitasatospora sp. NPDC059327 TaxID=3346803 RepID=UPI00368F71F0